MKINTVEWKEFSVKDIFQTETHGQRLQVPTGANIARTDLKTGDIPRITVSGFNNGVTSYSVPKDATDIKVMKNFRCYTNFISVSFLGTIFYHPYKASLDMKVHCLKPVNHELNDYTGKYLVSVLNKAISDSSYADQISSTVLPDLTFSLPVDSNDNPDWDYMEQYMKDLEITVSDSLDRLQSVINSCEFYKPEND